jgi:SAM-dependent methyltransferase
VSINFGDLRRVKPLSRHFGFDRGTPVDRYYIEQFLQSHASDIQGRTLEIGDDSYTRQFGKERTTRRDVLHVHGENPSATFVGDLTNAANIPSDAFDCCVLTQTLHLIYDTIAAMRTVHRILKPGGVLLATFPGVSQISVDEWQETWSWSFGSRWAKKAFAEVFADDVIVETYGNSLATTAFLHGMAAEELTAVQLDPHDPGNEMLIGVRAGKSAAR